MSASRRARSARARPSTQSTTDSLQELRSLSEQRLERRGRPRSLPEHGPGIRQHARVEIPVGAPCPAQDQPGDGRDDGEPTVGGEWKQSASRDSTGKQKRHDGSDREEQPFRLDEPRGSEGAERQHECDLRVGDDPDRAAHHSERHGLGEHRVGVSRSSH